MTTLSSEITDVKKQLSTMSQAVTETTRKTSTSSNPPNNELHKEVTRIQNETSELKNSVKSLSDELAKKTVASGVQEVPNVSETLKAQQKILEMHERELRRNNLVVVGIEESEKNDLEVTKSLLSDKLAADVDTVETKRLGKKNGRHRPILIKLPDNAQRLKF